jgi:hypothetical protein
MALRWFLFGKHGTEREMRFSIFAALLGLALAGCAGPDGNLNGQPYADEPGGAIAVKPQSLDQESYDPYATPAPFADMEAGQAAITPPPALNYTPPR